ncbi:MAG: hypothetical protein J5858_05675 [Lentisphaeria bacterium]|nr:hypothetical protein [Lentisphaeria bacterium]
MKIAKVLMGAGAGILMLSGCMTDEPVKQRASDERVEMIDNFSFKIELLSARTLINDDGLLTVDASALLSRTGSLRWIFAGDPQVTVWYHFDWIDADGNILPAGQHEMAALPGNIIDFHGVAPEEKYINYHLTISLKGPETEEEAAKQRDEMKKQYTENGKVKPAGKSITKPVPRKAEPEKKNTEKPVVKNEDAKTVSAAAPTEKKPAVKTEPEKAETVKTAVPAEGENKSKAQKLTEPFD